MNDVTFWFVVGGALGSAAGFALAKAKRDVDRDALLADLERVCAQREAVVADRDRWKRLANKLSDETEKQEALIAPIFRIKRGN